MSDPRRLALVGTGLIGGSIGLALGKAGYDVIGYDRDVEHAEAAVAAGAVGTVAPTLRDAVCQFIKRSCSASLLVLWTRMLCGPRARWYRRLE